MPAMSEIEVHAGSSEDIVVTLTDRDGNDIPDFTGWRAVAQVRYAPSAASAVLYEWDSEDGTIELISGADSHALLKMPSPEVSLAWPFRLAYMDMPLRDGNGDPAGLPVRAILRVVPGVTRFPTEVI